MHKDSVATHGAASFIAGFFATLGCNPVDVLKNRLMAQRVPSAAAVAAGAGTDAMYSGMFDCAFKTVQHEGPLALYKGFVPQWLRLGPWCMIMCVVSASQIHDFSIVTVCTRHSISNDAPLKYFVYAGSSRSSNTRSGAGILSSLRFEMLNVQFIALFLSKCKKYIRVCIH